MQYQCTVYNAVPRYDATLTSVKGGYPPKLIDTTEKTALLSDLGIKSGDTVHVERGAPSSNNSSAPSSNVPSNPSQNQTTSKSLVRFAIVYDDLQNWRFIICFKFKYNDS